MKIRVSNFPGYPMNLKKKFFKFGIHAMLEHEVLELLLLFARPRQDVRSLAGGLIENFGGFRRVLDEPIENLVAFPGMDADSAIILKVAKNCSDYYLKQKVLGRHSVKCGLDLIKLFRFSMAGLKDEQFRVVFLNTQNEIIEIETIHEGTIDQSAVYPRKVMERAIFHRASALIFVHNHTGGKPSPSYADREITNTLVVAANSMDIEVHDHIIIGREDYFSFRDEGLLNAPANKI